MSLASKKIRQVTEKASQALLDYCMKWEIHTTVTGVSGGLDSAVTLALSQKASELGRQKGFELKSIGLILPCQSDANHAILGKKVIKKFGAQLLEIELTGIFENIENGILKPAQEGLLGTVLSTQHRRYRTAQGNVKARLRMTLGTYYVANLVNGIVLSTDNYSEYWMGFWSLHGDVGDFGLIQELWKGDELPALAAYLDVPKEVIDAAPTDGLGVHEGGDAAQLGAPYPIVDHIIRSLQTHGIDLNGPISQLRNLPKISGVSDTLISSIAERAMRNSFKRRNPIVLTRKDLGL